MDKQLKQTPLITDPNAPEVLIKPVPYWQQLFQGRLSRTNYAAGSLTLLVPPALCLLYLMIQLLLSPNALSSTLLNPYDPTQLGAATDQLSALQTALLSQLNTPIANSLMVFMIIYTIGTLPLLLSLQVRRLHDLNHSGWLVLLGFVPIISYFFPIYVAIWPGTMGENRYGVKPISRVNFKEDILRLTRKTNPTQPILEQIKSN